MELHDHLYALGLQVGREVFDDADGFRGVLDDYLDEGDATTGDINLLVDAVRLGAFRSMLTTLDSGGDAHRAVEEAGIRLARDRGSADTAGAQWACAVLGFAVGRVGEADVQRFRTQTGGQHGAARPTPAPAATELPPVPAATPPPYQPPTQRPTEQPQPASYQPPQPAYQPQHASWPSSNPAPVPPSGTRTSRTGLFVGIGVTAVAVVVAVVLALVIAGGGGDDPEPAADDGPGESTSQSEQSSGPTETESATTEPVESTAPDGGTVSDEAAAGYTAALLTFSDDFGKASDKLSRASNRNDDAGALEASRQIRASVYDLDLAVRDLDLTPIQPTVNDFLEVSAEMISGLDDTYATATTALEVNLGFLALPTTDYTTSFQAVADEIDRNRGLG